MAGAPEKDRQRLVDVTLDEGSVVRWNPEIDHERKVATYDLLQENKFAPVGDNEDDPVWRERLARYGDRFGAAT